MPKSSNSTLKKVIPVGPQPCLALWVPCLWEKGDPFPAEAEEFFRATGYVAGWKWENGSTYPLRFQRVSGSTYSVSTELWLVWNPNTKEFYEYSDHDFKAKFKTAE